MLLPAVLAVLLAAGGCAPARPEAGHTTTYAHPVPPGETYDLAQAAVPDAAQQAARLARTRLLLLGEQHTEPRSHAFQRELLRRMAETGRPLVVALEMFPPAADPALEDWRQGRLDELTFLERAGWYTHWGFPWAHYRALFELLRDERVPLRGVNVTREEREAVRKGEVEALPEELRALVGDPDAVVPAHEAYVLDALRGTGHGDGLAADPAKFRRYYRVQRLWDRVMGTRLARLAEAQPEEGLAVLLVGSGHLAYGLGANLHAARATTLPRLTVWDTRVAPTALDAQGRYPVAVGTADWVRVYVRGEDTPHGAAGYPSLGPVRLEAAEGGVRVTAVYAPEDAPLHRLEPEDVVLALNGATPRSPTALRLAYERLPPHDPARFTVLRGGERITLEFTPTPTGH